MKYKLLYALTCLFVLAGCSKEPPDKIFGRGEEARKAQNFPLAIEQYSMVIREHPGSDLAETSQFMMATVYHNDTHEYQKAIDGYKRYAQKYPDGKQNPTAMFLIGFLYNNELHNLDSAAAAYRSFLGKYPMHEMATSAKFELDNLGKSPEELLPKPQVAEQPVATPSPKKKK